MKKRHFLNASLVSAAAGVLAVPAWGAAQGKRQATPGPALLTVSGQIGAGNRGALDPALDQMMVRQKISFGKAHTFDFSAVTALPAVSIKPTLEYDGKPHSLKGPLLLDVLKASGARI